MDDRQEIAESSMKYLYIQFEVRELTLQYE